MWRLRVAFLLYLTVAMSRLANITCVQAYPSIQEATTSSSRVGNVDEKSLINTKRHISKRADEPTPELEHATGPAPGSEVGVQAAIDEMQQAHTVLVGQFSPANGNDWASRIRESNRIRAQHVAKLRDSSASIPQKVTAAQGLHEAESNIRKTGLTSGRELYIEGHRLAVDAARTAVANAEPHITRLAEVGEANSGYEQLTTLKTHLERLLAETPVTIPKLEAPYLPVP